MPFLTSQTKSSLKYLATSLVDLLTLQSILKICAIKDFHFSGIQIVLINCQILVASLKALGLYSVVGSGVLLPQFHYL